MALTKVSAAMFSTAAQTSDLNLDDGTLFVDSSENKVAIGNTAPAEALDITGNMTLRSRGYVKLQDDSGGQFVALRAPATVSSNVTWSLPPADGSSGQSLVTDGSGALSWQTNYLSVSAGTGVTVSSNTISIGQAVGTSDSPTFTNLTLSGNLTVNGSTVTNSATNTTIEDLLIELGTGTSGTPSSDAGIVIERGSSDNVFLGWDESADAVVFGTGSFTGASSGNLTITPATIHVAGVGIGTTSPDVSLDIGSKTDAVHVPVGTTGQRPGSPAAGYFRYNSTTGQFEGYTTSWGAIGGGSTTLNTDTFTGNGSTTDFTISQAIGSVNNLIVFIDGVYQNPDAYSLPANTTLRFSAAPANGRKIAVYSVAGVVQGTNLNIDSFTGDGSDTTFTLSITPVNENNTLVYVGGVYQQKSTYSVSGTTLTFSTAPPSGASIEVATMNQTNINVPVDDTITTAKLVDANVTTAKIADNAVTADKIVDNVALPGNITTTGTLTPTGVLTANAGVVVDNITIDGTGIDLSSGNFSLDVAGQIILDADSGGDILFRDGGTDYGKVSILNGDWVLTQPTANKDILFKGNDGSALTALTLDMSDAGAAQFNSRVGIGVAAHATAGLNITASGSNQNIRLNNGSELGIIDLDSDGDLIFWAHGSENIKFVNGTGTGTERMVLNSDGILILTPDSGATTGTLRLHNGNGNGTLGRIDFGHSGNVDHGSIQYTGNMNFFTGDSTDSRFFIGMNGEVGINTTSPEHHLHVTEPGTSKEDGIVKIGGSSAALGLELTYNQAGATTTEIVANPTYTNTSSLMRICVDRDANANQISLLGNGKTGFGTDTPYSNARVTVNGGIRFKTTPWSDGDALNVIAANTYTNYNVANVITTVYYKCFILTIYSAAGYSQCFFIANAGAGTGFGFTALRPDSATPVSGNLASGFTVDVTGNGNEEFLIQITYGGGSLSVKRTAADNQSSSWGVFVHVLSG